MDGETEEQSPLETVGMNRKEQLWEASLGDKDIREPC